LEESPLSQRWYKRKQSFISPAQKRILREHWPTYGIDLKYGETFSGPFFDINSSSSRSSSSRKVALDIGFGTGDSIVHMAAAYPNCCYLGVEIHRAGIAKCIGELTAREISSERVRLVRADVLLLFERHLPAGSLDEIHCYFPDPWPNEYRDGERRVVRERTVTLFAKALKSGGLLRIATDVPDYAKHVERTLTAPAAAANLFTLKDKETYEPGALTSRLRVRGVTKYERRAAELGHSHITEFLYQRNRC
jgi:tRNA (guanine-N7-)-methyltransferase